MQRQQASQTPASRNHRQSPQEKPGEKLQRERERIAGGIRQQQDRHQWPELCRAAETACRMAAQRGFMRAVSGLYQVYLRPPYSPPKPHARAARHPCKIHSQHHQHSRQTASTSQHRPPAPPAQRAKPHSTEPPAPADSPHNSTTASASTRHRKPAPHQAGQIGTTTAATGATTTTGPARRA